MLMKHIINGVENGLIFTRGRVDNHVNFSVGSGHKKSPPLFGPSGGICCFTIEVPRFFETQKILPIHLKGSDEQDHDPNEGPQHQVTLTQGFYMAKYEVTVGQYVKFLEAYRERERERER